MGNNNSKKRKAKEDEDNFTDLTAGMADMTIADNTTDQTAKDGDIMQEIELDTTSGSGRTAQVQVGRWKKKQVAVKVYRYKNLTPKVQGVFELERKFLQQASHPNLVQLLGESSTGSGPLSLVLEYVPRNLQQLLMTERNSGETLYGVREGLRMVLGLARACAYVQSCGYMHRDLKPHNILVTEDFEVKLCDFGSLVKPSEDGNVSGDEHRVGTSGWAAPEVLCYDPVYSFSSDVFAFGICAWCLVAHSVNNPLVGMTGTRYTAAVLEGTRPVWPVAAVTAVTAVADSDTTSDSKAEKAESKDVHAVNTTAIGVTTAMQALVERCWASEPSERPSFVEVCQELEKLDTEG